MHFDPALLVQAMDMVATELKLPQIDQSIVTSSLKPSKRRSADMVLLMAHPDWNKWLENMPAIAETIPLVCQQLADRSSGHVVHISSCRPESRPRNSIAISFDRSKTVTQILSHYQQNPDSGANHQPACHFVRKSVSSGHKVALVTVKTSGRGWTCRRIDLQAAAISHLISLTTGHEPDLHEIVAGTGAYERSEITAEFEVICRKLSNKANEEAAGVEIDGSSLPDPSLKSCSFILHPDSNVIPAVMTLKKLIPVHEDVQVVLMVHHSLATAYKRAAAVISLTQTPSPNFRIIPVDQVKCDQDPDEFTDWLKNMLVAQSVTDDCDLTAGDGPVVQMDMVLKLFQTCIQFLLLSKKPSDRLTIDQSLIRSYLFVQYNVSRLNALIHEFDTKHSARQEEADLSLLTSDLEWDLVFKHVHQFESLQSSVIGDPYDGLTQVISYLLSLSGDLSKFYSKTRVLVHNQEHAMPLIAARVTLLRIIRSILIKCLTMLSVQPVDRM